MKQQKKPQAKKTIHHHERPEGVKQPLAAAVPPVPPAPPVPKVIAKPEQIVEVHPEYISAIPALKAVDLRPISPDEPVVIAALPKSTWQKICDWLTGDRCE